MRTPGQILTVGITFGLLCSMLSAHSLPQTSRQDNYADPDGYRILSILLDEPSKTTTMWIHSMTIPRNNSLVSDLLHLCGVPDAFKSAATDFEKRNRTSFKLMREFTLTPKYELVVKPPEWKDPFPVPGAGGQEMPHQPFMEDAIIVVSAVGFDKNRSHAIAYTAVFCGGECGGGRLHFLKRVNALWVEAKVTPACEWMS